MSFFSRKFGHPTGFNSRIHLKMPQSSEWRVAGRYWAPFVFLVSTMNFESWLFIDQRTAGSLLELSLQGEGHSWWWISRPQHCSLPTGCSWRVFCKISPFEISASVLVMKTRNDTGGGAESLHAWPILEDRNKRTSSCSHKKIFFACLVSHRMH